MHAWLCFATFQSFNRALSRSAISHGSFADSLSPRLFAHSQLLSMRRKHHQYYVVQTGGALSAVVLFYQFTISMITEVWLVAPCTPRYIRAPAWLAARLG